MRENTQLQWIAEAEARSLRESALSQRDRIEPPIEVVWSEPRSLWRAWLDRTLSRRMVPPEQARGRADLCRFAVHENGRWRTAPSKPAGSKALKRN